MRFYFYEQGYTQPNQHVMAMRGDSLLSQPNIDKDYVEALNGEKGGREGHRKRDRRLLVYYYLAFGWPGWAGQDGMGWDVMCPQLGDFWVARTAVLDG